MTPSCTPGCLCDCCTGTDVRTPRPVANPPGSAALAYRVGTHTDFLASMLARLGTVRVPDAEAVGGGLAGTLVRGDLVPPGRRPDNPLAALTVRTTDDPAIALLDAWAAVLDVLTFYQERVANEGYLRTATEFRSVLELARLVGYEPRPGVAATTYLAYGLETGSGLTIPRGSRATSVPGAGELPQAFETAADLAARDRWNGLVPRRARPQAFEPGQTTAGRRVWFAGLATLLKPNDPLLLVFDAARGEPFRVRTATPDNPSQTTRVVLQEFSTTSVLGDEEAALKEAGRRFERAYAAFLEAEGDRPTSRAERTDKAVLTPDDVFDKGVLPVRQALGPPGSIETVLGKLTPPEGPGATGLGFLRWLLREGPVSDAGLRGNIDNLIARFEAVEDYLIVRQAARRVMTVGGFPPFDLSDDLRERHDLLFAAWQPEAVRQLSSVTLANLLYDTQQFIIHQVPDDRQTQTDYATVLELCGRELGRLARAIFRPVLKRFLREPQAGVNLDTVTAVVVATKLHPFLSLVNVRDLDAGVSAKAADALRGLGTLGQPALLDDMFVKARAVAADPANSTKRGDLKSSIDAVLSLTAEIETVFTTAGELKFITPDLLSTDPAIIKQFEAVRDAAEGAGFTVLHTGAATLVTLLQAAHSNNKPGRFTRFANIGFTAWKEFVEPGASAFRKRHKDVEAAITDIRGKLDGDLGELKTALEAFLNAPGGDRTLIDVQPDRVGLGLADQIGQIAGLETQLREGVGKEAKHPLEATLGQIKTLRARDNDHTRWTGEVADILRAVAEREKTNGDMDELTATERTAILARLDGIKSPEGPAAKQTTTKVIETLKALFKDSAGQSRSPHRDLQAFHHLATAVAETVPGSDEPALVLRPNHLALAALAPLTAQITLLFDPSEFLARLNPALAVVRQQARVAAAGNYPRVSPWLDEFVATLDQLISDLTFKGYDVPKAGTGTGTGEETGEAVGASDDPLAVLQSGGRRLDLGGIGGRRADVSDRQFDDRGTQVVAAFDPAVGASLYEWLRSVKVVRRQRFQGIHALRARAAPFGHNAPLQTQFAPDGTPKGAAEWPLTPRGLVRDSLAVLLRWAVPATKFPDAKVVRVVAGVGRAAGDTKDIDLKKDAGAKVGAEKVTVADVGDENLVLAFGSERGKWEIGLSGGSVKVFGLTVPPGDAATQDLPTEVRRIRFAEKPNALTIESDLFDPGPQLPKNVLRLDMVYDKVTPGSFIVIERAAPKAGSRLDNPLVARVEAVTSVSPTDYGMPATKVTQLTLDRPWLTTEDTSLADIRDVTVYLQSEPLELAGEPFDADLGPVFAGDPGGATIDLDQVYDGLPAGRLLIVAGERTDVPGTAKVKAAEVAVLAASQQVLDAAHTAGQGLPHTRLILARPLAHSYQRGSVTVYGNVAPADQGETRHEVLGAGDATAAGQRFTLKQGPLTHLAAPTPTGAEPAIEVRVNGVLWDRAERFDQLGPDARGYVVRADDAGRSTVVFGDGDHGHRLPTGADNVRAKYRSGLGRAGNVGAGQVSQLASRPLGVKDVINPLPAVGGADRETTDQVRRNAPIGVTALGRLVSVADFEDFARGFAGVAKARAVRLADGVTVRVHLTLAGRDGDEIPADSDLYRNLVRALRRYGDPALPLTVAARGLQFLVLAAELRVAARYEYAPVAAAVRAALAAAFAFDNREFAQPVYQSDVIGVIQGVRGVAAARLLRFGAVREWRQDGTPASLDDIVTELKNLTEPGAGVVDTVLVPDTRFKDGAVRPAEIAFLTPRVPDLLTLREWTP